MSGLNEQVVERRAGALGAGPIGAMDNGQRARTRERLLFEALNPDEQDEIGRDALLNAMRSVGLRPDDPRFIHTVRGLKELDRASVRDARLDFDTFVRIVRPNILIVERALQRSMIVPEFDDFADSIVRVFDHAREVRSGHVADYIPQLGRVDPEKFGVALCTVDGQRLSLGDAAEEFCVQSTCKPVNYCMALEERGEQLVHTHIGCEPSGHSFNELTLNVHGRPHNPLINAGAIMCCSLISPQLDLADRFDHVLATWERLCGGVKPGFSNPVYLSERQTADRNFALGYFMRENNAFPEGTDLVDTLEFYFQCCSLEVTAEAMSVLAATLANGGVCPLTGERVLDSDTVQRTLSLMYSCGMYDFSGEWAFRIGLPAKSGVSGALMVVVPNVMGLCVWSPRLDVHGNSVRGVAFCDELVRTFNFHNYDNLVGGVNGKTDPRTRRDQESRSLLVDLIWAGSEGDLDGIRRLLVQGVDLDAADYDGRTALHLAASEGHEHVVEYLLAQGVSRAPVDRWGNTPAVDAERGNHAAIVALLDNRHTNGGSPM